MNFFNESEYEAALQRVSDLLDRPPASGTVTDQELTDLLTAIAAYGPDAPAPSAGSAFDRIRQRVEELSSHAERVRRAFERTHSRGFGGLPLGGEGMGPTTGG